jgi:hypothetical protein
MDSFSWKFDVALSFAGADRSVALAIAEALRKLQINVFYDEWHKSQTWGRDLSVLLPEIYSSARFCVVLISQSYLSRPFAQHELETILARRMLKDKDFFLPVRLDESQVPGLSETVAYIEYSREGVDKIASLIASRVSIEPPCPPINGAAGSHSGHRTALKTHRYEIPEQLYVISDKDLIGAFNSKELYSTPLGRSRLARELVIYLNYRYGAKLGTPYGAWREDNKVYLSTLPDFEAPQRTLEFTLDGSEALNLTGVWSTMDERYAAIPYQTWQPAVKGLTADRADLDLDREVVIKILEDRRVEFGFPIVPEGSAPEKLCAWIAEEPPTDFLNWSRDPRLVPGSIGPWQVAYHRPSGVGILLFSLHGRWTSLALQAFMEALRVFLPTRHRNYTVDQGNLRISVFLCEVPDGSSRRDEEFDLWPVAVDRVYAAIARLVAATRGLPLPPPRDDSALPPLSFGDGSLFDLATREQGESDYTKLTDQAEVGFRNADWIKLRHRFFGLKEPRSFDFAEVVTPSDIMRFVENHEQPGLRAYWNR